MTFEFPPLNAEDPGCPTVSAYYARLSIATARRMSWSSTPPWQTQALESLMTYGSTGTIRHA